MRVLVVHDRENVRNELVDIVNGEAGSGVLVEQADDFVSAHRKLSSLIFDLMIIDLTLPHMHGRGEADYSTADRLLQELFSTDGLNCPGDIVGITKDSAALSSIANNIGPHLMGIIEEDNKAVWKQRVRDAVAYARRASETRLLSINSQFWYDAAIITALDKELAPHLERFECEPSKLFPGSREFGFRDSLGAMRRGVMFAIGKSGQASAASYTQSILSYFRPKIALMSGFCGGIKAKKVNIGDLIVFESALDWDYGKWQEVKQTDGDQTDGDQTAKETVFHSRPDPVSIAGETIHLIGRDLVLNGLKDKSTLVKKYSGLGKGSLQDFAVHLGPVASGSAVVANDEIVGKIRGLNESIVGVDMESFAFYYACRRTHVRRPAFVCMKAVADHSNGNKGDEYHATCSEISANAVAEILTARWNFEV